MAEVPEAGPEMVEGPANAKNFDDDVIRNFSEVTSQTLELTGANITGLRSSRAVTEPGNTPYFSSRVYSLPWAILLYESSMYYFNTQYGEYDYLNYIVKGGYGIIYKGRADTVYKSIDIDMKNKVVNREKKFREIYLEAFTQTVLQNDPTYGHNIGRIEKLYRDKSLTTTNPESERRYLFYIKMEHIQFIKFHLYIDSLKGRDGLVSFAAIKPMLRQLAVVLEYFERNYGFYHCDLHRGNVLLKNDPTQLKIIDFGKACMKPTTTGRVFAVEDTPCKSYDILFFIYSFFEAFFMFFAKDAVDFFESLTKLPNGKDLFFYLEEFKDSYSENAKFHVLYPYAIDNRHRFCSNKLSPSI